MPRVRNITVAVSPDLYRQTRRIAADSDTTVTELVRHILIHLPELLRNTNHPAADQSAEATPPSSPALPASFTIPPSQRAAPSPQQAPQPASRSQYAASSAMRSASLPRSRAAALRQLQHLLRS
jgi:hypothetical protein